MGKNIDKIVAVGGAIGTLVNLWDRFSAWRADRAEKKLRADYDRLVAKSRAKAAAAGEAARKAAAAKAKVLAKKVTQILPGGDP
jgi:hypothetical protein